MDRNIIKSILYIIRNKRKYNKNKIIWCPSILTEYGGLGLDFSYSVAVAEELGNINCGGIPMAIGVQSDMATPALAR